MAADEFIQLLAIGTGLDVDFLEENVGIDEAVDLTEAIIQVNDIFGAVEKGKNLIPRAKPGMTKTTVTQITAKQKKPGNKK